jgi:hypothetical protein
VRLAIALAAAVVVMLLAPTLGQARQPTCLVSNERTGFGTRSLQEAIDAAAAGDTLVVKGTCVGSAAIARDVTLKGVSNKQFGTAALDGAGSAAALLEANVCCESPDIRVSDLTLRNGTGMGIALGGFTGATLELNRVTMTNLGSGVQALANGWSLRISDSLFDNSGIAFVGSRLSATLLRSTVRNGNGLFGASCGRCSMDVVQSQITGNASGGLGVGNIGSLTLTDSTVSNNGGPGVTVGDASAEIVGSRITGNTTDSVGGGILVHPNSGATVRDSIIAGNTASLDGGGAWVGGELTISDSTLTGNVAGRYGGGAYVTGGFSLADSTVTENVATSGGGLYFDNPTSVSLLGTNTITGNEPDDCVGSPSC